MENIGKIYSAIPSIMNDIGAISKDKVNKQQGFKFRGIDDVYNALQPALIKNKVFIVPEIIDQKREVRKSKSGTEMICSVCTIKYTFYAEDGSFVETTVIGEGMDTGDKATNKAMAIAYKYACFQVFCIPTEEMDDPDAESPELEEGKGKKRAGRKKPDQSREKEEPADPGKEPGRAEAGGEKITEAMLNTIRGEQKRTGVTDRQILSLKAVKARKIEEMNVEEFKYVMETFKKTDDINPEGRKAHE